MIKIISVDDHPLIQAGLKMTLAGENDIAIDGAVSNAAELFALLEKEKFDLVLLDITLPDRNGLEVLKDIKVMYPELPVIMLTMHAEEHYAIRCLKAGAAGYVTKRSISDDLLDAINSVMKGDKYISPSLSQILIKQWQKTDEKLPHEAMSDRELQVATLLARGKTVGQIAVELNLSRQTVTTYRSRALDKLSAKDNAELTRYMQINNLV